MLKSYLWVEEDDLNYIPNMRPTSSRQLLLSLYFMCSHYMTVMADTSNYNLSNFIMMGWKHWFTPSTSHVHILPQNWCQSALYTRHHYWACNQLYSARWYKLCLLGHMYVSCAGLQGLHCRQTQEWIACSNCLMLAKYMLGKWNQNHCMKHSYNGTLRWNKWISFVKYRDISHIMSIIFRQCYHIVWNINYILNKLSNISVNKVLHIVQVIQE